MFQVKETLAVPSVTNQKTVVVFLLSIATNSSCYWRSLDFAPSKNITGECPGYRAPETTGTAHAQSRLYCDRAEPVELGWASLLGGLASGCMYEVGFGRRGD